MKRWIKKRIRLTRDGMIFFVGIAGIIHEVFFTSLDRPDILVLFMAMVGLPAFLRGDESIFQGRKKTNDQLNGNQRREIPPSSPVSKPTKNYDDLDSW